MKIDRERYEVRVSGKLLNLTVKQFLILSLLRKADGRVLSRQAIVESCWGINTGLCARVVDMQICRIRREIKKCSPRPHILAVSKAGYKLLRGV